MRQAGRNVLLALALASASPAAASVSDWAEAAHDQGDARVEARLLVHPERTGEGALRAGVIFTLDPGWHLYWKHPGETGLPTRLSWRDADASATRWPAPAAFRDGEDSLTTYGYEGNVLLASELRPHPGASTIAVEVEALACHTSCIPARFSLERPLERRDGEETAEAVRRLFALHDAALPVAPAHFGADLALRVPDPARPERLELDVAPCAGAAPCSALDAPSFFPAAPGLRLVDSLALRGRLRLVLERDGDAKGSIAGVLAVRGGDGRVHPLEVDLEVPAAPQPFAWTSFAAALALGVLGGLLLNLMPCVLPVLALKAFAAAELAAHGRREALAQGLAYTAGVLLSMLALGATVLALRSAGHEVGWGFQLQSPAFVVAVSVLCTAFALNLLGVFEIGFVPGGLAGVGAGATGARRSFCEGLLAVALATPCSAPFLGTAVGFAFASSGPLVLAIFLAIGLGLAAPFLAICALPRTARLLPRPGKWMLELRSLLGFALLATVVWLAWVMGRSAGVDALAGLLVLLLVVALGAHALGKLEGRGLRGLVVAAALGVVVLGSNRIALAPAALPAPARAHAAWSPDAVAALRAEGRPVVVVFGADWCLTCKWNERNVLADERVSDALARGGWAVLHADWTRRDETIRRELARFGRAGVPLVLVYPAGATEPRVLPDLLSVERMLVALERGEARHAQSTGAADAS
jgi:thiol:disulfide interchange protein DsbD